MDDEQLTELEGTNPYPIGSDEWHRHNLGIPLDVCGFIDTVESDERGMVVKGWYFGPPGRVPLSVAGRMEWASTQIDSATLIEGE